MNTLAASSGLNIAPLVLMAPVIAFLFYFMVARPQKRNLARHKAMVDALAPGDEIITSGGIYGKIVAVNEDSIQLEVSKGTQIQVATRSIAMKKADPTENYDMQDSAQSAESQDS